jgi:hypothetical protein
VEGAMVDGAGSTCKSGSSVAEAERAQGTHGSRSTVQVGNCRILFQTFKIMCGKKFQKS